KMIQIFKDALASFESKTTRVAARFIPFDWLNEKFENNNEIKIISFLYFIVVSPTAWL
ncbi:MAG: hypothetical protein Q609_ECAC02534G0001, partial [Escherichia coli DORA_A_5_14_21]